MHHSIIDPNGDDRVVVAEVVFTDGELRSDTDDAEIREHIENVNGIKPRADADTSLGNTQLETRRDLSEQEAFNYLRSTLAQNGYELVASDMLND